MSGVLPITGEYPADWKATSDRVWAEAGHRCIRCLHPFKKGEHGKGEWTPCDERCVHGGPIGRQRTDGSMEILPDPEPLAGGLVTYNGPRVFAQWRVATVHHFDGAKNNCVWWNLLPLCQRCHLKTQARVNPHVPYIFEHSDWLKPYVAGFYAKKYEGRDITRAEAEADLDRLLALERLA